MKYAIVCLNNYNVVHVSSLVRCDTWPPHDSQMADELRNAGAQRSGFFQQCCNCYLQETTKASFHFHLGSTFWDVWLIQTFEKEHRHQLSSTFRRMTFCWPEQQQHWFWYPVLGHLTDNTNDCQFFKVRQPATELMNMTQWNGGSRLEWFWVWNVQ